MTTEISSSRFAIGGAGAGAVLLALIFAYAFLFPTFFVVLGNRGAILVNGGLMFLIIFTLLLGGGKIDFQNHLEKQIVIGFLVLMLYYFVHMTLATVFLSEEIIFRDLFELHKPVLHALSFLVPFLFPFLLVSRYLDQILIGIFIAVAILALTQISTDITPIAALYTDSTNAISTTRVTIPFRNPYDLGYAISFFTYFFAFRLLIKRDYRSFPLFIISLVIAVLTQSRGVFFGISAAFLVGFPLVLFLDNYKSLVGLRAKKYVVGAVLLLVVVAAIGLLTYQLYSERLLYLVSGLEDIFLGRESRPVNLRREQIDFVLSLADESIWIALFGNGVSKAVMDTLETSYTFYTFRYGVIGLGLIFFLPLLTTLALLSELIAGARSEKRYLSLAIFVWMFSLMFVSVSNAASEQIRVSFQYYFLMGFAVRLFCSRYGWKHGGEWRQERARRVSGGQGAG